eukprot:TRINITY_DN214_c0_g1_i2.p1 TRINITY_DN214_c0_g1~~TRINITY_DN214_c0_g1_i2.p1  ORF type:complete len:112 (+),score=6.52 TRINITY_DN214_c0_g1_i2:410-745(+)
MNKDQSHYDVSVRSAFTKKLSRESVVRNRDDAILYLKNCINVAGDEKLTKYRGLIDCELIPLIFTSGGFTTKAILDWLKRLSSSGFLLKRLSVNLILWKNRAKLFSNYFRL